MFYDKTHVCFMTRLMYVLWQDSCMFYDKTHMFYDKTHVCFMTRHMSSHVCFMTRLMTHMFYDKTHVCFMTRLIWVLMYVLWQDSVCDMTHSYVCRDSFTCVTWPRNSATIWRLCVCIRGFSKSTRMTPQVSESRHTYDLITSQIRMNHVTHVEAVRMYTRIVNIDEDDATGARVTSHIWIHHVTNTNESRHAYVITSHMYSKSTRITPQVSESRHAYELITSQIQIDHVTHVNSKSTKMTPQVSESRHSYELIASQIRMNHVTHIHQSRHTYESKIDEDDATGTRVTSLIWINRVTNTNESRHTYVMKSHTWIQNRRGWRHRYASHATHMNSSRHKCEWITAHICIDHVTLVNSSHHTCESITSHVTHMHESRYKCEWIMSHFWINHVTHESITSHICINHVTHIHSPHRTYKWV